MANSGVKNPVQRLLAVAPGACGSENRIWRIKQICFKSMASVRRFSRLEGGR